MEKVTVKDLEEFFEFLKQHPRLAKRIVVTIETSKLSEEESPEPE